jgi:hypothetical protein
MRHVPQPGLLDGLKQALRELENLKLLSPRDLDILDLRRTLREKILRIENQQRQRKPAQPSKKTA